MRSGLVYAFTNPGLSDFKVGRITRILYPFEIASRHAVDDPAAVDALAHGILARYWVPRSKLFACDLAPSKLQSSWSWNGPGGCAAGIGQLRPAVPARDGRPHPASGVGSLLFLLSAVAPAALLVHFRLQHGPIGCGLLVGLVSTN